MRYFRKAIEDTGVPGEVGPVDSDYSEVINNVETARQNADDIHEMAVIVENETDSITELEGIEEVIGESYNKEEPIPSIAAEAFNRHIDSIMSRLVITPYPKKRFPSTESFSKSSSRHNLAIAKESIAETIKEAWKAFKKFVSAIWEKIKNFFAQFFQNTDKLKKRAKDYKNMIMDKTAGKTAKEKTFKDMSVANCFCIDGKTDDKIVIEIIKRHGSIATLFPDFVKLMNDEVRKIDSIFKAIKDDALDKLKEIGLIDDTPKGPGKSLYQVTKDMHMRAIINSLKKNFENITRIGFQKFSFHSDTWKKDEWDTIGFSTGIFAYEKFLVAVMHVKKEKDGVESDEIDFTFEIQSKSQYNDYKKPDESVPVLDANAMTAICDEVSHLADSTDVLKKAKDRYAEMTNAVLTLTDSVLSLIESIGDHTGKIPGEAMHVVKKIKAILPKLQSGSTKFITWLPVYNVKAGNMALDYVKKSMQQYS